MPKIKRAVNKGLALGTLLRIPNVNPNQNMSELGNAFIMQGREASTTPSKIGVLAITDST